MVELPGTACRRPRLAPREPGVDTSAPLAADAVDGRPGRDRALRADRQRPPPYLRYPSRNHGDAGARRGNHRGLGVPGRVPPAGPAVRGGSYPARDRTGSDGPLKKPLGANPIYPFRGMPPLVTHRETAANADQKEDSRSFFGKFRPPGAGSGGSGPVPDQHGGLAPPGDEFGAGEPWSRPPARGRSSSPR